MIVEVIGINPSNKGALMMLDTIEDRFKREFSDQVEIVFRLNRKSDYKLIKKRGSKFRLAPSRHILALFDLGRMFPANIRKKLGVVTISDIDCFIDASGFAYGDQWTYRMSRYSAKLASISKKKDKPYILMPQAFGPFNNDSNRNWTKKLVDNSRIVFSRDTTSYKEIDSLKCATEHYKSPDITINHSRVTIDNIEAENKVCIIPNEKVFSDSRSDITKIEYLAALEFIIENLAAKNIQTLILNHEGESDRELCNSLSNKYNIELIDFRNHWEVKSILSKSLLVISSRFHGCVSALSQGVPTACIGWSHKYEELFTDFGVPELIIDDLCGEAVEMKLRYILSSREEIVGRLQGMKSVLSCGIEDMWKHTFRILK